MTRRQYANIGMCRRVAVVEC